MSQPSEEPAPSHSTVTTELHEFSVREREILLQLAHDSIRSAFEKHEVSLAPPTPHLAELRGAFTTLYVAGQLRGCVGYALPVTSLYRTVAETARSAAFDDARFWPLKIDELPNLEISLSILSPLRPIRPEEVEIGRHGLLVSLSGRRGLLLPQVPVEHGWDRVTFLQQTCRKAGLPQDAWESDATLQAFTAEIFGDHERT
jgi:uncharacterized protein